MASELRVVSTVNSSDALTLPAIANANIEFAQVRSAILSFDLYGLLSCRANLVYVECVFAGAN